MRHLVDYNKFETINEGNPIVDALKKVVTKYGGKALNKASSFLKKLIDGEPNIPPIPMAKVTKPNVAKPNVAKPITATKPNIRKTAAETIGKVYSDPEFGIDELNIFSDDYIKKFGINKYDELAESIFGKRGFDKESVKDFITKLKNNAYEDPRMGDLKILSYFKTWFQTRSIRGNFSGWKFHIFSDNYDDSLLVWSLVDDVVKKWGCEMKIGGGKSYSFVGNPSHKQYGKGTTIYLPSSIFSQGKFKVFLKELEAAIFNYNKVGKISGDQMLSKNIGYRWELNKVGDPKVGISREDMKVFYRENDGKHIIPGMKEIYQ